jgi:hypothetical protein
VQVEESREPASLPLRGRPWADLLARHRGAWIEAAVGGRDVVDLATAEDPAGELAAASRDAAIVWIDGFEAPVAAELREDLRSAVRAGAPVIVGLPPDEAGARAAQELCEGLGAATILGQELAAGSLITAEPRDPVLLLVCANVVPEPTAQLDAQAAPLLSDQLARLERANRSLREANVRLAREQLGLHDAAAAAVAARRIELEDRVQELEEELARKTNEAAHYYRLHIGALQAPRYRAVDKLRDIAFKVPGINLILRLRRRRLKARHEAELHSGDDAGA